VIGLEDAVFVHPSGGGGYGDPLWRVAAQVAEDVRNGKVSGDAARNLYGVVLDRSGDADEAGTADRRGELRRLRLGTDPKVVGSRALATTNHERSILDCNLSIDGDEAKPRSLADTAAIDSASPDRTLSRGHSGGRETRGSGTGVLPDPQRHVDRTLVFGSSSALAVRPR